MRKIYILDAYYFTPIQFSLHICYPFFTTYLPFIDTIFPLRPFFDAGIFFFRKLCREESAFEELLKVSEHGESLQRGEMVDRDTE